MSRGGEETGARRGLGRGRSRGRSRLGLALVGAILAVSVSAADRAQAGGANALAGHPSPYLALHGADPVHWQTWGAEALARARREGKLIFVSSGYFACHWCHVMQRESFRDAEVAAFLNRHFVSVKVDRELLPALDSELMRFVERTDGRAGWPLSAFLTPSGLPLIATAYLPRDELLAVLRKLQQRWASDGRELTALAEGGSRELGASPPPPALEASAPARLRAALVGEALRAGDELAGGFGRGSKFPASPQLLALLALAPGARGADLDRFLRLTLDQMARLGLRDQVSGGFFRYATDPQWQTPHFEKMLYDNALLAEVYRRAAEALGEPAYREVAVDTLDFLLARMADPGGGFVASLSAVDASGAEGGSYLWTREELEVALEDKALEVATLAWGLEGAGPFEGAHLPMAVLEPAAIGRRLGLAEGAVRARLAAAHEGLRAFRAGRPPPADHKLIAGWNGLALEALAGAVTLSGGARYRPAAERLAALLQARFWDGRRLARALIDGRAEGEASLEDYAYVAAGLLAWAEVSADGKARTLAARLAEQGWARFRGERGWRLAEAGVLPFGGEEPLLPDGATPSPSAVLLRVSLRLGAAGKTPGIADRARAALRLAYPALSDSPLRHATHLHLVLSPEASP